MADRWLYQGLAEPPLAALLAETVTLDKWYRQAEEPTRVPPRAPPTGVVQPISPSLFPIPGDGGWLLPVQPEPIARRVRTPEGGHVAPVLPPVAAVTMDAWFRQSDLPVRKRVLPAWMTVTDAHGGLTLTPCPTPRPEVNPASEEQVNAWTELEANCSVPGPPLGTWYGQGNDPVFPVESRHWLMVAVVAPIVVEAETISGTFPSVPIRRAPTESATPIRQSPSQTAQALRKSPSSGGVPIRRH